MLRLCLVWLLAPTEVAFDAEADLDAAWLYPGSQEPAVDHRHLLHGYVLPGLINYKTLDWTIEAEGLQSSDEEFTTGVRILAQGEIEHPFVSEIEDLSIAVGLYLPAHARDAFERLTMPPLQLTQADLDRRLPSPMATLSGGSVVVESVEPGGRTEVSIEQDLGLLSLSWHDMPAYVALTESYALVDPVPGDIKLILERGGTADFAALARWANDHEDSPPDFGPRARQEIMDLVRQTYRRLRAPPALGDFQRLGALVGLIRTFGASEDIESLLKLERPMKILHTSALLSYDLAVREEASLGLPVHGMRDLPAQSKLLDAPEAALKALRAPALHHLLRLAFDPVDFRDAPADMGSTSGSLSSQAANLLAPLTPTDVVGVLAACAGDKNVEREVLRFYIDARHQPVVDHLVDWLTDHPEAISDLGTRALAVMPEAMLAPLMRHYVDPQDPEHRTGMRRLLEAMPNAQALQVLQMLQSLGLHVAHLKGTPQEQVAQAFTDFELAERRFAGEKAKQLVDQLKEAGSDIGSLRASVRAASRLLQLDPTAIGDHARLIIDLLTAAALEFDAESPAERARVLGYLRTYPFGALQEEARRAAAMTEARLSIRRGATPVALEQLLEFDGALSHIEVRTLFIETLMMQYRKELASGAFKEASSTLDLAERHVPNNLDIEVLRHELLWAQYKPAFILGAAFALALVTTLTWLLARLILDLVARLVRARRDIHRLLRRQADAKANTEDAARFSEPDLHVAKQPPASATRLVEESMSYDLAANDPPAADASPDESSDEELKTPPSTSKPVIDDALLGEFAVDDGFDDPLGDPLGDPFDDLNDDPFSDDFGWGQDLSPSEVRNG